jgi:TRAP-type C4-dicarboxylate transport system substrate-binding protein
MKKALTIILALALVFALMAGCGGNQGSDDKGTESGAPADTNAPADSEEPADNTPASDGKSYTLSFANFMPAGGIFEEYVINYFNEQLTEKSGGRLSLDIYSGGSLCAPGDVLDACLTGIADIAFTYTATSPGSFPVSSLIDLPYDYASAQSCGAAFNDFYNEYIDDISPELEDAKVLMVFCGGPGVLLSNEPITTVDQFKGLQVRTNSTLALVVSAIGGTPVTMGMGEIYEGLRTGVVDSYIGAVETVDSYAFDEVTKYGTMYPLLNTSFYMFMSPDAYDALPADLQQVIDEVAADVWATRANTFMDHSGLLSYEATKGAVQYMNFDEGEVDKMLDMSSSVITDYAAQLDGMGFDGQAMIDRYHELVDQYNETYPSVYDVG